MVYWAEWVDRETLIVLTEQNLLPHLEHDVVVVMVNGSPFDSAVI